MAAVNATNARTLVVDDDLTAKQQRNLEEALSANGGADVKVLLLPLLPCNFSSALALASNLASNSNNNVIGIGVLSCLFLSCLVLLCLVLSRLVLLCLVSSCLVLSCYVTSRYWTVQR